MATLRKQVNEKGDVTGFDYVEQVTQTHSVSLTTAAFAQQIADHKRALAQEELLLEKMRALENSTAQETTA